LHTMYVRSYSDGFVGTVAPFNWHRPVYELDVHNPSNNGYKNEDLIVWMRAAAFPSFRKLYRRVDHSSLTTTGSNSTTGTVDGDRHTTGSTRTTVDDAAEEDAVSRELFASGLPAGNYTLTVGYGRYMCKNQLFHL